MKMHSHTGLLYIWDFHPSTETRQWLRYDTFVRGKLMRYPFAVARAADLVAIPRDDVRSLAQAVCGERVRHAGRREHAH